VARITDNDFITLLGRVEDQGGEHASVDCTKRIYSTFCGPMKVDPIVDPGCGVPSFLDVVYDPHADVYVDEPVLEPDPARIEDTPEAKRAKKIIPEGKSWDDVEEVVTQRVLHKGNPALGVGGVAEKGIITVCAYHDGVFGWPRFQEEALT
jgi:hypothetical protein